MRTSVARLGLGFGKLGVTVRGTTKYHISPIEQRAFAGAFAQGLPNTLWRIRSSFFIVVPPFIMSYLIFTETEKEHDRYILSRFSYFDQYLNEHYLFADSRESSLDSLMMKFKLVDPLVRDEMF